MKYSMADLRSAKVQAVALACLILAFGARVASAVEIEKVVSPGGVEAWLVEDHTVPIIALNFSFEGGSSQDPEGQEGLTRLLAATLDEGAGDLTSEAFQARMEELAISIGFSTGKDRFFGSLRTLAGTLEDATGLLALALNEPRFDSAPLDRVRAQLETRIKRNETDPDAIAGRALADVMFNEHTYVRPTLGTLETLERLTSDDLRRQHRKLLAREGLTIGVVGAIGAEALGKILDKVFLPLPETADLIAVDDFQASTGDAVYRELDVPQTSILIGYPGLRRNDPDFQAAFVMNHILGGGSFTSWMYQEVREKRGLTYGAGTSLSPYKHTGLLIGSTSTQAEKAEETLSVMLDQLERMATEGPSEAELASAKRFLTGSYPLRFDSSGKIARQLVALQNADLGMDYFDRRNSEIEAVTLEDIKRVAKRLLGTSKPTIIQVGPGQG